MPVADPLKASRAEKKKQDDERPPEELLGTGSKIPESHDSRMRSQFAQPGDNYGKPRKLFEDNDDEDDEQSWWTDASRPPSVSCKPYKDGGKGGSGDGKGKTGKGGNSGGVTPRSGDALTQQMAREQAMQQGQMRALENQKDSLLRSYCGSPNATSNSAESQRVIGQVSEINRQLGLPAGHFGNWKIPT